MFLLELQSTVHDVRNNGAGRRSWWRRCRVIFPRITSYFLATKRYARFTCNAKYRLVLFPSPFVYLRTSVRNSELQTRLTLDSNSFSSYI